MNLHSILQLANQKSVVLQSASKAENLSKFRVATWRRRFFLLSVIVFTLHILAPPDAIGATRSKGLSLIVSVPPQEYLLNKLKTPQSVVNVVIKPGQNPTTWDPSPRQMQKIVSADIMFPIGVPFEAIWLPRLRERAPSLVIADTLAGVEHMEIEHHHHHGHEAKHGSIDPHIWLDPLRCIRMAENMAATLQQIDPAQFDFYAERLEHLRTELQQLHHDIEKILTPLQQRTFMVFHPSWGYFAARYNLQQIALEKDGKEPSGVHLARLIEQAQQEQIKVIFVQQQFSTKSARAIAAQTGARIETLDPLASDLADSLRRTARTLARSLAL